MKHTPNLSDGQRPFPHAKKSRKAQEIDLFLLEHAGPGPRLIYYVANWLKTKPDHPPKRRQSKRWFRLRRKAQ